MASFRHELLVSVLQLKCVMLHHKCNYCLFFGKFNINHINVILLVFFANKLRLCTFVYRNLQTNWKFIQTVSYPSPDNDFYNWLLPDIFGYNFQKCQLQLCCWANFQLQRRAELKNATMGTQFSRQRACVTSTAVLVQHSSTHTSSYPRELSKTQLAFIIAKAANWWKLNWLIRRWT